MVLNEKNEPNLIYKEEYNQDVIGSYSHRVLFFDTNNVDPKTLKLCYILFGGLILLTMILVRPQWPWKKQVQPESRSA